DCDVVHGRGRLRIRGSVLVRGRWHGTSPLHARFGCGGWRRTAPGVFTLAGCFTWQQGANGAPRGASPRVGTPDQGASPRLPGAPRNGRRSADSLGSSRAERTSPVAPSH